MDDTRTAGWNTLTSAHAWRSRTALRQIRLGFPLPACRDTLSQLPHRLDNTDTTAHTGAASITAPTTSPLLVLWDR